MHMKFFGRTLSYMMLSACFSASAKDIGQNQSRCQALLGVSDYEWPEITEACREWLESDLSKPRVHYYLGRTLFDKGYIDESIEHFKSGAEGGDALSDIALHYAREGFMGGENATFSTQAAEVFQRYAESGNGVAQLLYAYHLTYKDPGKRRPDALDQILALYEHASDGGQPVGTFLLGSYKVFDQEPENDAEGIRLLYVAAENGVWAAYDDLQAIGEIEEPPLPTEETRYRWATPFDVIVRQP